MKLLPVFLSAFLLVASCKAKIPTPSLQELSQSVRTPLLRHYTRPSTTIRPEIQRIADELGRERGWSSSHVGAAGAPSPTFAIAERLLQQATREEKIQLLSHPGATVREYVAQDLIDTLPADIPALAPLLQDTESTEVVRGCGVTQETVSEFVASHLAYRSDHPAREQLIAFGATSPATTSGARLWLLRAFARINPSVATQVALAVRRDANPFLRADAISALTRSNDPHALSVLLEGAEDADPTVRAQAAEGLRNRSEADARAALARLQSDSNQRVRHVAQRSAP